MSADGKTFLPLTPNTDPAFNVEYAAIDSRDFVGLLIAELNRDDGKYFGWINAVLYPRILEHFGPGVLQDELTNAQRFNPLNIEFDQHSGILRNFRPFLKWTVGCKADYLDALCNNLNVELSMGNPGPIQLLNRYQEKIRCCDGKLIRGWEMAERLPDSQSWYVRRQQERYLGFEDTRLDPLPESRQGRIPRDSSITDMRHPPPERNEDYTGEDVEPEPVNVAQMTRERQMAQSQAASTTSRTRAGPSSARASTAGSSGGNRRLTAPSQGPPEVGGGSTYDDPMDNPESEAPASTRRSPKDHSSRVKKSGKSIQVGAAAQRPPDESGSSSSDSSSSSDDSSDEEEVYGKVMETVRKMKEEITSKMVADPCQNFFVAPQTLDRSVRTKDPSLLYIYRGMRELLNAMPYIIRSQYTNSARLDMVDKAQDMMIESIDKVEKVADRLNKLNEKRDKVDKKLIKLLEGTQKEVNKFNSAAAHQVITGDSSSTDPNARKQAKMNAKRDELKRKLKTDVLRFDRLTEPALFLINNRGFQIAAMEMIMVKLPERDSKNLRNLFAQTFYETLFTKRLYTYFYVPSSSAHNVGAHTIPMPTALLEMRDELITKHKIKGKFKDMVLNGFALKPGEIREQRRVAIRKKYGPDEKREAEIAIFDDMLQFRNDHAWYRNKFVKSKKPMESMDDFLNKSNYRNKSDDKYKNTTDEDFFDEQKAPERSMEYMRALAKELDDAFCPKGDSSAPDTSASVTEETPSSSRKRIRQLSSSDKEGASSDSGSRVEPGTPSPQKRATGGRQTPGRQTPGSSRKKKKRNPPKEAEGLFSAPLIIHRPSVAGSSGGSRRGSNSGGAARQSDHAQDPRTPSSQINSGHSDGTASPANGERSIVRQEVSIPENAFDEWDPEVNDGEQSGPSLSQLQEATQNAYKQIEKGLEIGEAKASALDDSSDESIVDESKKD